MKLNIKQLSTLGVYSPETQEIKIGNVLFFFDNDYRMKVGDNISVPLYKILDRDELNDFETEWRQTVSNYYNSNIEEYRNRFEEIFK